MKDTKLFTKKERKVPFSCRMSAHVLTMAKAMADEYGISVSQVVENCIVEKAYVREGSQFGGGVLSY